VIVYVAMIDDRRFDADPRVFFTADAAIVNAKKAASELARQPSDVVEGNIPGSLYYAKYSEEDDCVWVVETEVRTS